MVTQIRVGCFLIAVVDENVQDNQDQDPGLTDSLPDPQVHHESFETSGTSDPFAILMITLCGPAMHAWTCCLDYQSRICNKVQHRQPAAIRVHVGMSASWPSHYAPMPLNGHTTHAALWCVAAALLAVTPAWTTKS